MLPPHRQMFYQLCDLDVERSIEILSLCIGFEVLKFNQTEIRVSIRAEKDLKICHVMLRSLNCPNVVGFAP